MTENIVHFWLGSGEFQDRFGFVSGKVQIQRRFDSEEVQIRFRFGLGEFQERFGFDSGPKSVISKFQCLFR